MVLVACVVTLLGGYALKGQCLAGFDGRQYERLCYNDIQPLYGPRLHVTDPVTGEPHNVFPYERPLVDGQLPEGAIEYPVLTGVFMWATGLLADDGDVYLVLSAIFLAPFGLFAAYLLARMKGMRALLWAAAPAIVLYAFHNWDLLVVAATVSGFFLWSRGHSVWAAVAFAVGAALKLYPAFFLPPLVLERWFERDRRGALSVAVAGAGAWMAINAPFALKNFDGWFAPFDFHRLRGPNFDNIWAWPRFGLESLPADELNARTAFLTGAFFVTALALGWLRGKATGSYPFVQVSAALLVSFLLWNKVHSPQYTLWLLPFFVLVGMKSMWAVFWWAAYSIFDVIVYVGVFRYFYDFGYRGLTEETFARGAMIFGVWTRAAILLALFVVFLFARSPSEEEDATEDAISSYPSSKVSTVRPEVLA